MIAKLFSKVFICSCKSNHGINKIKQLEGNRIVGRCLKCKKRVYGQFLFDESKLKEFDVLHAKEGIGDMSARDFLEAMGKKGCGKVLYENDDGEVLCGSLLCGGIMLCMECQGKDSQNTGRSKK